MNSSERDILGCDLLASLLALPQNKPAFTWVRDTARQASRRLARRTVYASNLADLAVDHDGQDQGVLCDR